MDKIAMKTNKKLLAAFAVLVMAFCAFAVLAPASDADGSEDTDKLAGMYDENTMSYDASTKVYTLYGDTTIVLNTNNPDLDQSRFVGDFILTITGPQHSLTVNYDFGSDMTSTLKIFNVKEVKVQDGNLGVNVKNTDKTEVAGDRQTILGNTDLTVTGDSGVIFMTDLYSSRISSNGCVMTITGQDAAVHFYGAVSFGANLVMRDGAKLKISGPLATAGNIYADIEDSSIIVKDASGNHALNIYGAKTFNSSEAAVIKNSTIKTDGILGLYGSTYGINAEGSTFNADSMYVVRSTDTNPLSTKLIGADINVAKIGAPRTNAYTNVTDYSVSKLTFDGVTVIGETAVDPKSNLSTYGNGIAVADNGKLILKQPMYGMKYTDGTKVIIGGNEYTVYHYKSGDIEIQYGISCGDVYYTGKELTKLDVKIIAISLTQGFTAGNVSYELEYNGTIKDHGTYTDALGIQITFTGDVAVTSNLRTDLFVKPAPLDIRFGVPDEYNGIAVGDFQKIQIDANSNIVGKVGYYNLADDMDGYYLVITAQVYDKKGNLVSDAQISTEGMESVGDGKYMLFLGKTFDEARQKLDSRIGFTAECGKNYIVPESWIDLKGIQPVDVMSFHSLGSQNILGAYFGELYDTLEFVAKNDPTQFEVIGKLLWKANYDGFSSDFNETRGWYIPFHMYNNDTDADFWKNSTADIQILKLKENVELDGEFVFRIVDINVDPVITLKDPNGFKTRYVLDISKIEFGSATGYGETKLEAEEEMSWNGIEPEKLTENGSDVIDKTMFMIFNTSAYRGQKVIATATNITDGLKTSYSEEITIGEDQNICIWYFSFDHQFKNGEPGVYKLEVKAGDETVAEGKEARKGVKIFTFGFEEKAEDAKSKINVYRPDIENVSDKTFFMIAGIYGYPQRTTITASMLNSDGKEIIKDPSAYGVTLSGPCDERIHAFYFSFENGDQVSAMESIYGLYEMRLMNGNDVIESRDIKVAAKSWLNFRVNELETDYGTNLEIIPSESDSTKYSLNGKLYYREYPAKAGYFFSITWDKPPYPYYLNPDIELETQYNGSFCSSYYCTFSFTPNEERIYKLHVDFDGDKPGYEATTYTFTFVGEFEKRPYGIYLSDPFYGDEPLEYTFVNETPETDTSPSKKFMSLPAGPDGSKTFIGWESENGKLYSAGAFVIISDDMDPDNDGKAVFTAVYANAGAEFTVTFDGEVYGTYEAGEMLTMKPVPEGKIAWALNNTVISGQYTVLRADADDENVISFVSVAKVSGIQRTEYTISKVVVEGGSVLVKVDSEEVGGQYFNMNGHFYYKLVSGTQSDIVPSKEIYAFGEKYTEMMPIMLPENYETKGYAVYFCVDYGQQTIVLSKILVKPTIYSGYYEKASIANKAISKFSGEKIEDAVDKTAFMTFDVQEEGEYEARCLLGDTTVISETFSISAEKIAEKHADGKLFAWYFTFGSGNVSTNPIQIDAEHVVPGGVYTIEILKSGTVVASAQISLPSV